MASTKQMQERAKAARKAAVSKPTMGVAHLDDTWANVQRKGFKNALFSGEVMFNLGDGLKRQKAAFLVTSGEMGDDEITSLMKNLWDNGYRLLGHHDVVDFTENMGPSATQANQMFFATAIKNLGLLSNLRAQITASNHPAAAELRSMMGV